MERTSLSISVLTEFRKPPEKLRKKEYIEVACVACEMGLRDVL